MTDPWPWLTLFGLGAFHGINPAMGWLFAVALGLQEQQILELDVRTNRVIQTEVMRRDVDADTRSQIVVRKLRDERVCILDGKHIKAAYVAPLSGSAQAY